MHGRSIDLRVESSSTSDACLREFKSVNHSGSPALRKPLADIAELLGELQQANLGADDPLFSRHGVLQCAEAGPDRSAPASARDSPWGQDTSGRLSFS
jgi:hypothetical protein